ncbi:MAG TPA: hypothetical protein VFV48_05180, partial [Pseudomonadales bacterium]|nr:hypothetical protein [Pseudomonadales bacterium]
MKKSDNSVAPKSTLKAFMFSLGCASGIVAMSAPSYTMAADAIHWSGFFTGAFSQSDNEYPYGRFYSISDKGSYLSDSRLGLQ